MRKVTLRARTAPSSERMNAGHLCGKCKKRGKTCKCVKKAIYLARVAKGAKDAKETESKEPQQAPMESMMASIQAFTKAFSTRQEEATMAERKHVSFEAGEELEDYGMTAEMETKTPEGESVTAYFTDDMSSFGLTAEMTPNPGIPDDAIDLDLYSDSVEESELKEG